jgi:uncharacterized protein
VNYRTLGRTGIRVSEVGFGGEHLEGCEYERVRSVLDAALAAGINVLDVFMSNPKIRTDIGRALAGRRDRMVIQGHIGAGWIDGQYCRTRDPGQCRFFFADLLERLQTDTIDVGMLHYVDDDADYDKVFGSPVIAYARELKEKGVIKAIGMSSHSPLVALRAARSGLIDVLMFSLNPAYDLLPEDSSLESLYEPATYRNDGLNGTNPVRLELYKTCEALGVAITVMKGLGVGTLLEAATSPFGVALTPVQCLHYALTRPAVASVMLGFRTPEEVRISAAYSDATAAQRDYSVVLSSTPKYSMHGKCMYCNHCLPCPSHIDIAAVNKYLDMTLIADPVPETVRAHYLAMGITAAHCVECGSCEENCPFGVPVIERMKAAVGVFGK